jgi:carbamoyltransferase
MGNIDMADLDLVAVSGQRRPRDLERLFTLDQTGGSELPAYYFRFTLPTGVEIKSYDHHQCHAATAYYLSPDSVPALVMVSDGFGDDCSLSIWQGDGPDLHLLKKYPKEGSLGWFYSNVTEALGWIHGDGEGKTMALAAGADQTPAREALALFCPLYLNGELTRPHSFGPISKITERGAVQWHLPDADQIKELLSRFSPQELAAAAQALLEENHTALCNHWLQESGMDRLCLAGGVFLNIILNRKLAATVDAGRLFVFPNPGDSGLGLGAALCAQAETAPAEPRFGFPAPYLGPEFSDKEIKNYLQEMKLSFTEHDEENLCREVAESLAADQCVGWFQGRMESGPRALGNRSILMSPLQAEHQEYINRYVKFREPFRPFCPSLLHEDRERYLIEEDAAPYMILAFTTPEDVRSNIGAVVHSDGSIRPQVVTREANPRFHRLLRAFKERTGQGILLNTSFNISGEPIVCTPLDAVRCFYSSGMDVLVLGSCVLRKGKN